MAKAYVATAHRALVQLDVGGLVIFAYTTGKTIATIDVAKDGAQFADGTSTCAEIVDKASAGSGLYLLTVSAADASVAGPIGIEMDDSTDEIYLEGVSVVNYDPEIRLDDGCLTAAKIGADAITAAKIATDAIAADGLAADAVAEIAAGVSGENIKFLPWRVQKDEPTALRRTIYFYAEGTLPAKASISTNGGAFADSTNAPATVNGNWRELELTAAECAALGVLAINVTTTVTVMTLVILCRVVDYDPYSEGAVTDEELRSRRVRP